MYSPDACMSIHLNVLVQGLLVAVSSLAWSLEIFVLLWFTSSQVTHYAWLITAFFSMSCNPMMASNECVTLDEENPPFCQNISLSENFT